MKKKYHDIYVDIMGTILFNNGSLISDHSTLRIGPKMNIRHVGSLHLCIDLDHLMFTPPLPPAQTANTIFNIIKKVCENFIITDKLYIWFKGIPVEQMADINQHSPDNPFGPYFNLVMKIRELVLHRMRSWPLEISFQYIHSSSLKLQKNLDCGLLKDFTWSPQDNQGVCKPAGAMYAKARVERLSFLSALSRGLRPWTEFIYSLPKDSKYNHPTEYYDWKKCSRQNNQIMLKDDFYDNALTDPVMDTKSHPPTGFNNPAFLYDRICLDIVSETQLLCNRCDVSEKLTRPMLLGMPFLTNAWQDYVLRLLGGRSYWDLLDIELPKIRYIDPPTPAWPAMPPAVHDYIGVRFNSDQVSSNCPYDVTMQTTYFTNDIHQKNIESKLIKGIKTFRNRCNDKSFILEVREVIEHNQKVMQDHNEKYSDLLEYFGAESMKLRPLSANNEVFRMSPDVPE